MSDTEILEGVIRDLKWHITQGRPMSPLLARDTLNYIEARRKERRAPPCVQPIPSVEWRERIAADILNRAFCNAYRSPQNFWRCEHHPSLIENPSNVALVNGCEHGCDKNELRWFDNGTCKPPTY